MYYLHFFSFLNLLEKSCITTNTIESLNRQCRKYTKTKSIFPNEKILMKMLYLATQKAKKNGLPDTIIGTLL
jgi:transposase-like protein